MFHHMASVYGALVHQLRVHGLLDNPTIRDMLLPQCYYSFVMNTSNTKQVRNTQCHQTRMFRFRPQHKYELTAAIVDYCHANDRSRGPMATWDTSLITDMAYLFYNETEFTEDISEWNTSSVTDMNHMFFGCTLFDQPLHLWDTSLVTNMYGMFGGCASFNQPLHTWNTSSVTNMRHMFADCTSFNQPLHTWNTSFVTNMAFMFCECASFDQPLHTWNTSSVTDMEYMFYNCTTFCQLMGNWHAPPSVFLGCPDPEYCCTVVHDYYWVK